jgi:hypothetical protein
MGTTFGYARAIDDAYIGYRVDGDGPIDIVHPPDRPGNIDRQGMKKGAPPGSPGRARWGV